MRIRTYAIEDADGAIVEVVTATAKVAQRRVRAIHAEGGTGATMRRVVNAAERRELTS